MEVKIGEEGDTVEMILPQYLPINTWSIEANKLFKDKQEDYLLKIVITD